MIPISVYQRKGSFRILLAGEKSSEESAESRIALSKGILANPTTFIEQRKSMALRHKIGWHFKQVNLQKQCYATLKRPESMENV